MAFTEYTDTTMNKTLAALLASATLLTPAAVLAQDLTGSFALGYTHGEGNGDLLDAKGITFEGAARYELGNNFALTGRANLDGITVEGLTTEAHIVSLGLNYGFAPNAWAGIFAEYSRLGALGEQTEDVALGLEGGYAFGDATVGGFWGKSKELESVGVLAQYAFGSDLTIGASLAHTEIEAGVADQDVNTFGIAAAYDMGNNVTLFGGAIRSNVVGQMADVTTFGLGGAYALGETFYNASVSLEVARSTFDAASIDGDLDTVRVGITVPFGAKAAAPANSVAASVFNPTHNALSPAVLAAF